MAKHPSFLHLWLSACVLAGAAAGGCKGSLNGAAEDGGSGGNGGAGGEMEASSPRSGRGGASGAGAGGSAGAGRGGSAGGAGTPADAGGADSGSRADAPQGGRGGTSAAGSSDAGTGGQDSGTDASTAGSGSGSGSGDPPGYNPCPAKGTACKIMGIGDSITDGDGSTHKQAYRLELFRSAVAHGQSIEFVGALSSGGPAEVDGKPFTDHHNGYAGAGIDPIIDRARTALQTIKPDMILMMAGTNNVWTAQDLDGAPERIAEFVDEVNAQQPNVLVVVATVLWQDTDRDDELAAFNGRLSELMKARMDAGKRVHLVDMFGPFVAVPLPARKDLYWDIVHPNDKGYKKMAEVWYEAVGSLFR